VDPVEHDGPPERCPANAPCAIGAFPVARSMPDRSLVRDPIPIAEREDSESLGSCPGPKAGMGAFPHLPRVMSTTRAMIMMARTPPTPLATRRGVAVGRSSGWEEDHVVVVTQRHELQAPEPDHCAETKWSCHLKLARNGGCVAQTPPTWHTNCRCLD
jgi:hypothetical protein